MCPGSEFAISLSRQKKARSEHFGLQRGATTNNRKLHHNSFVLIHTPVVCKTGDPPILLLCQLHCSWCHLVFNVCRCCWRGQRYCCGVCRLAAKRKSHREAQRRYRQTPQGKKAHRQAENRRRHRVDKKNQKNMDDASSRRLPAWCMGLLLAIGKRILPVQTTTCCHFCGCCGQLVDNFPRRGYAQRRNLT